MVERKLHEVVEINNRKFVIHLMPAAFSIAVLKELLSRALPIDILSLFDIGGINVGSKLSEYGLGSASNNMMSMEEFAKFQNKLLLNVQERLPGMDQDVIDQNGNYMVEDLEFNIDLFSKLILKVVSVNYKDFFIEKLKQLKVIANTEEDQITEDKVKDLVQSLLV